MGNFSIGILSEGLEHYFFAPNIKNIARPARPS